MATIAERVKRRAADRQADVTVTQKSNQSIKHHGTEISTNIHILCPELMAMIFSHLDTEDKVRAACVCCHWRDLIDIPSVWRDFRPILYVDDLTSEHLQKMHIRKIRQVKINKCDDMKKMTRFLKALPHLKNLSFNFLLSLTRLYPGKKTFPGITHLTIDYPALTTGVLRSILQPMVNLQYLSVNCIPKRDILCALRHSKHLLSLHINCCSDVILSIVEPSMVGFNPILSLNYLILEDVFVGNSGLDFISRAFSQLCELELMLSFDVTRDGLKKLAKLKQLKKLAIRSEHFEHGWIEHLDTEQPQLEELSLHGCESISNKCLQSMSKMPALRVLEVPIQGQEVEGLHALSQGCPGLQTLALLYGNQSINQGLHVVMCMPYLQKLILFDCKVNDDFWRENSESFSKLRSLSLIECQLLSEHCLPYLSHLACLSRLLLKKCMSLGNEGLKHLRGRWEFKALTCLLLIELGIKDDGLHKLSKNTPILEKVRIVSCKNVTEDGLAAAVLDLPQLKALCTDISAGIKDRLKSIRPHLQCYCV